MSLPRLSFLLHSSSTDLVVARSVDEHAEVPARDGGLRRKVRADRRTGTEKA